MLCIPLILYLFFQSSFYTLHCIFTYFVCYLCLPAWMPASQGQGFLSFCSTTWKICTMVVAWWGLKNIVGWMNEWMGDLLNISINWPLLILFQNNSCFSIFPQRCYFHATKSRLLETATPETAKELIFKCIESRSSGYGNSDGTFWYKVDGTEYSLTEPYRPGLG